MDRPLIFYPEYERLRGSLAMGGSLVGNPMLAYKPPGAVRAAVC